MHRRGRGGVLTVGGESPLGTRMSFLARPRFVLTTPLVGESGSPTRAGDCARHVLVPGVGELAQTPIERNVGLLTEPSAVPPRSEHSFPASYLAAPVTPRFLLGDRLLLGIAVLVLITNLIDQSGAALLVPV